MQNKLEEATAKHLRLLIEELADKNITGIRFLKQGNKVMLLFDKMLLSKTNQQILNALNVTYPNIIVSINDSENPFDYEELYEYYFEYKFSKNNETKWCDLVITDGSKYIEEEEPIKEAKKIKLPF